MNKLWPIILWVALGCTKSVDHVNDFFCDDVSARNSKSIGDSINVKSFGAAGDGITDDTKSFELAMEKANLLKKPVYVPIGVYKVRLILSHDSLRIVGQRRPATDLTDGSIIRGLIDGNYKKNILVSNLGIDSRGQLNVSDDAAVSSGVMGGTQALYQQFSNLVIIGSGLSERKHGMLCQAGTDISIKNIFVYGFYHGIAIRSGNVVLDSAKISFCQRSSVIVKSDYGNLLTQNVSIDHITVTGDIATGGGGPISIQSYGDPASVTKNIRIQHITSEFGDKGCIEILQDKGKISDVYISNCRAVSQADYFLNAHYDVTGGANIVFDSCTSINASGFGFRCFGSSNVRVLHSYASGSKMSSWAGAFTYLQLNGIEIIK